MSGKIQGKLIKGKQIARGMYEVEERGVGRSANPPRDFVERIMHYAPSPVIRRKLERQLSKEK